MSDLGSVISGLFRDASFWQAVLLAIAAWVLRSDSAQLVLRGIGAAILAFFKQRLPANQYAVLKKLAEDAVTYAWQQGQHANWNSDQKASEAQSYLKAAAQAHGLGKLADNSTLLTGVIETVWHEVKPAVVAAAAYAEQEANHLALVTPPADAGTPFNHPIDVAPPSFNSAGAFSITSGSVSAPAASSSSVTSDAPAAADQAVSGS